MRRRCRGNAESWVDIRVRVVCESNVVAVDMLVTSVVICEKDSGQRNSGTVL